ncbi:MAG TPA: hypothetical protein PLW65_27650 [Pseudomonadota bacterium]|nr:hypothetical protein [Pseudomonadota bacterium]
MDKRRTKPLQPGSAPPAAVQPDGGSLPAGTATAPAGIAVAAPAGSETKVSPPRGAPPSVRRAVIDALATAFGQSWARRSREELHREGRAAAGGWPGTVGEATAYVAQALLSDQHRLPSPMLTTAERELLTRAVYASARHEWLRHLDPEAPKQKREI